MFRAHVRRSRCAHRDLNRHWTEKTHCSPEPKDIGVKKPRGTPAIFAPLRGKYTYHRGIMHDLDDLAKWNVNRISPPDDRIAILRSGFKHPCSNDRRAWCAKSHRFSPATPLLPRLDHFETVSFGIRRRAKYCEEIFFSLNLFVHRF